MPDAIPYWYSEIWFVADLRGGKEFRSAYETTGEAVWVHAVAIAHARQKDGSLGSLFLVELDEDADFVGDWYVGDADDVAGAQAQGADLAEAEALTWEPIPDVDDVRRYVRRMLRRPLPGRS